MAQLWFLEIRVGFKATALVWAPYDYIVATLLFISGNDFLAAWLLVNSCRVQILLFFPFAGVYFFLMPNSPISSPVGVTISVGGWLNCGQCVLLKSRANSFFLIAVLATAQFVLVKESGHSLHHCCNMQIGFGCCPFRPGKRVQRRRGGNSPLE